MVKIKMRVNDNYTQTVVTGVEDKALYRKYKAVIKEIIEDGLQIIRSGYCYHQGTYDGHVMDPFIGFVDFLDLSGEMHEIGISVDNEGCCRTEMFFCPMTPKEYRKYGFC